MKRIIGIWMFIWTLGPLIPADAQGGASIAGRISSADKPLVSATILINRQAQRSDSAGRYQSTHLAAGSYLIKVSYAGYESVSRSLVLKEDQQFNLDIELVPSLEILNEVVVTGVSKAALIRENPVAIASVSSKTIDRTIESNIIDALVKNVSGLNAVKTGPNISKPFIRGLGYNRVLTLYDGIRQEGQQWGDEHGIEVDGYNIIKAEVIKGPASLMFGSDALAGVVSLFPYLPTEADNQIHGRVLSEYQGNNGLIGNGLRMGYRSSHWMWTISGAYRLAKNYSNTIDGRVYNTGFKEANAGAGIGYLSQKGFSILNATWYDDLQGIPDGSRDSLSRAFTKQVFEGAADEIRNRPIVPASALNSYALSPLHQHIQHRRIYSNHHYQIGHGEIDATLGFQQNIRREYNHPTLPTQPGLHVRLNTINYGIRYTAPEFSNIELSIGTNGMNQNNKSREATDFPIPDYRLSDWGTYIYGKWKSGSMTISGGLRYDLRTVTADNFYTRTNASTGFAQQAQWPDTVGATLQFPALNKTFHGLSISIGATYQLTPELSLKANLSRGYRSPNIPELASNGLDPGAHIIYLGNRNFVPEFSLQQDLAISGVFPDLSFSLSLFNNHIQDYIYLSQLTDANGHPIVDAQGNKTFQYEQGSARLYGAEGSLNIHPQFLKGFNFDNMFSVTTGVNTKSIYKDKGNEGEWLPLIPPLRWVSSVSQQFNTNSDFLPYLTARAELEYNAAQKHFLALYHTETATPSYSLINLSLATAINYSKSNQLQLQLQVNNLLDLAYQNNLSRLKYFEYYSQSADQRLGIYNMGRNVCVKVILSF